MAIGAFDQAAKERLSALVDGELDAADPAGTCAVWAHHAEARRDWHAWNLIGDVLRSEDLASDPRRDRLLCAAVRARLEREPVVLAPVRDPAPPRARWSMGVAMAAGFVLVAGTFAFVRIIDTPRRSRSRKPTGSRARPCSPPLSRPRRRRASSPSWSLPTAD